MKILSAVGLGIAIIVLKLLMSEVFHAFEYTLVSLFDFLQQSLGIAKDAAGNLNAGVLPAFK